MDKEMRKAIIIDNYENPRNRGIPEDSEYIKVNSNSVSCIDNIDIYVKIEDDIIKDVKYEGEACVIAISSTSILSELIIGKSIKDVREIIDNYFKMIEESEYDEDILKEASVYSDISKQPARKNCATLFLRGIQKIVK